MKLDLEIRTKRTKGGAKASRLVSNSTMYRHLLSEIEKAVKGCLVRCLFTAFNVHFEY